MSYVDGFVLALPADKLEEYRDMAETAAMVWKKHGALDYKECLIDHDNIEGMRSFADTSDAKEGEVTIFAFITYNSREHRDAVNAKVMADPEIQGQCDPEKMPFDCKRMAYGGFKTIVEA